ncbi:hypothetical protein Ancab_004661, partial [Ancistrocladus abbreviatus]
MGKILGILWSIWQSRNLRIFPDKRKEGWEVWSRALRIVEAYQMACKATLQRVERRKNQAIGWQPPLNHHYKINSDAAVDKTGKIGMGFMIRDSEGRVQACGCSSKQMAVSSTVAKALALRFAVETFQAWGNTQTVEQRLIQN